MGETGFPRLSRDPIGRQTIEFFQIKIRFCPSVTSLPKSHRWFQRGTEKFCNFESAVKKKKTGFFQYSRKYKSQSRVGTSRRVNEKEESFTKPFFRSNTNIYIRTCIFLKRYVKELKEHLNRSIDRPSNNSFHALHPALDSIFHPVRANSARALQQRASKKSIIARGPRAKWNKIGYLFIYGRGTWAKVLAHGYR